MTYRNGAWGTLGFAEQSDRVVLSALLCHCVLSAYKVQATRFAKRLETGEAMRK